MTPKTILIVEDTVDLAETLFDILTLHGHRARIALNGKDAIAAALSEPPDLILLDIRLPDMTGYDVFQAIRNSPKGAAAKILILTASESREHIAKNINVPLEHILFKPNVSVTDLVLHVEKMLTQESAAAV
jgi:DNA-binding response OmpR family regulator